MKKYNVKKSTIRFAVFWLLSLLIGIICTFINYWAAYLIGIMILLIIALTLPCFKSNGVRWVFLLVSTMLVPYIINGTFNSQIMMINSLLNFNYWKCLFANFLIYYFIASLTLIIVTLLAQYIIEKKTSRKIRM